MASAVESIQAWVFTHEGYPDALHRATLAPLPRPALKELHVRVKAAALNPVDIQLMNIPVWKYLPSSWISPVKGIGEDFSGVVEAAGKHSGFDIGDEVGYCAYHQRIRCKILTYSIGLWHHIHAHKWHHPRSCCCGHKIEHRGQEALRHELGTGCCVAIGLANRYILTAVI